MSSKLKKDAMLQALKKSLGVVSVACKQVGISRPTHYNWLKDDSDYAREVDDISNEALDFAEHQLHLLMESQNPAAIIFYLKTKGKQRGYIERQETSFVDESVKEIEVTIHRPNANTDTKD